MKKSDGSGAGIMITLLVVLILSGIGAISYLVVSGREREIVKKGTPIREILQSAISTGGGTGGGGTPGGTTGGTTGTGTTGTGTTGGGTTGSNPSETPASGNSIYYFYNQQTPQEQALYDEILEGIQNVESTIRVSSGDSILINHLYLMVLYDHPELFWLGDSTSLRTYADYAEFSPKYGHTGAELEKMKQELAAKNSEALNQIGDSGTNYEKVKRTFEYIVQTVDYDLKSSDNQNIYSSMVNRVSVCSGYAREMQYLLQQMGIECLYIPGDIKDEDTHAWNIVNIDGTYYQVDVTFGDVESDPKDNSVGGPEELKIAYAYLCCTDEELYRDHIVRTSEISETIPVCSSTDLSYYRRENCFVEQYTEDVWEIPRKNLEDGKTWYSLQFATKDAFDAFRQAVEEGKYGEVVRDTVDPGTFRTWSRPDEDMFVVSGWYE